ncbi:MAG: HDOD domain-containing protein [Phycisphaerales bacterium]|nr:HDOD domain-containing protein [Phycisphaerales bacterium]
MNSELLEEVLSCPSLPSLPAVALRVIELTSDRNVSLELLAETIQNDQGLAAKVLRTVNSSFYGLRTRCSTINKALVMLGLSPVKSLALGFSLVSSLTDEHDNTFDYVAYWRRGLFTGVAARCIAESARMRFADEAFLGGLLQDVGQMAMYRALGKRYLDIMARTAGDHRRLARLELTELEVQHADLGAMLAQRWKLPDELVMPVKYHERPTAAPAGCVQLVQAVGLGNYAHDALTDEEPAHSMRRLYGKAQEWFGISATDMSAILRRIAEATKEMSALFRLDTGRHADPDEIVRLANQKLIEVSRETAEDEPIGEALDALLLDSHQVDPLTGALTRAEFDATVRRAFQLSRSSGERMSILNVALDGFRALTEQSAPERADEVLVGTVALLKKHFEPMGGAVCRVGTEIFAVVFLGTALKAVERSADEFRGEFGRLASAWAGPAEQEASRPAGARAPGLACAVGIASLESVARHGPMNPAELVMAAARAVQESRAAGCRDVRIAPLRGAAA